MQFLIRNRVLLSILMGIIAIAMLVSLIYAIKNGSKEKIIGLALIYLLLPPAAAKNTPLHFGYLPAAYTREQKV